MFGGFGTAFDNDPFFSMHAAQRQHMQQMQQMMQNPFGMMGHDPFMMGAITDGREPQRRGDRRQEMRGQEAGALMPRDPFGMGDVFGNMFQNMNQTMGRMQQQIEQGSQDPNSHFYSQQSVYSYNSTGGGAPRVYQATTSTRQAPGGIRETRKAVKDSEAALEKLAIGHHIGERGHVIERSKNTRTGDQDEQQDYINLDEEEGGTFHREWQERTRNFHHPYRAVGDVGGARQHDRDRHARHARDHHQVRKPTPAIMFRDRE